MVGTKPLPIEWDRLVGNGKAARIAGRPFDPNAPLPWRIGWISVARRQRRRRTPRRQ